MQLKKQQVLVIVLGLLVVSALACGPFASGGPTQEPVVIGGEEPVATEAPEATEEPPPPPPPVGGNVLENPAGGFDLIYPSDWVASDIGNQTVLLAESQAVLNAAESDYPPGAAVGIIYGQTAQILEGMDVEPTSENLLDTMMGSFVSDEGGEAGQVETRQFASESGVGVPFTITDNDPALRGYIATYVNGMQGVVIVAIVPEDQWDAAWPAFDSIMSSMVFYPPQGPAALGESTPIQYGDVLMGFIPDVGGQEVWTFDGFAGDVVTISMVGLDEDFDDTFLELYGPDGILLIDDDDSGEGWFALIEDYTLPETGEYAIVARAWGIDTGSYEISLTLEGEDVGGGTERTIAYGDTVSAELTEDESRHFWAFNGTAGDVVTISAVGVGEFDDTFLELRSPDGDLLVDDDDSGDGWFALIEDFTLPETGTYEIMVRGFAGAVGEYDLTLTGQ